MSETEWMLDAAKGNVAAFEQIMNKYKKLVLNTAFRYIRDEGIAEDAAQEIFVKIYNSAKNYEPKAKLSTWIYRITVNHCLNILRNKKKHQVVSLNTIGEIPDTICAGPASAVEHTELEILIKNAVNSLPERQQTAIILKKYQKLSYQEISKIMNCSVSAVDSLLQRAKESLKIYIAPYFKNKPKVFDENSV